MFLLKWQKGSSKVWLYGSVTEGITQIYPVSLASVQKLSRLLSSKYLYVLDEATHVTGIDTQRYLLDDETHSYHIYVYVQTFGIRYSTRPSK